MMSGRQAPSAGNLVVGKRIEEKHHPVYRALLRRYPILRLAHAEAIERFLKLPGVCGIGIGRKFSETNNAYMKGNDATGGMAIKVYVTDKLESPKRRDRIPKWIIVEDPENGAGRRVGMDVVTVGEPQMSSGHGWPSAGAVTPGRIFAFGNIPANGTTFSTAELGTPGAVVRHSNGIVAAISAAHVFMPLCSGARQPPTDPRAIGVLDKYCRTLPAYSFFPADVRSNLGDDVVRDVMSFTIPDAIVPGTFSWPSNFKRELARDDDIERALLATTPTAFIWVERDGNGPVMIPVDLESGAPRIQIDITCNSTTVKMTYAMIWRMRFIDESKTTISGDSGSGVFIWDENNVDCRLLGFHFIEWDNASYAADARAFFRGAFGTLPGDGIEFA